MPVVLPSYLRIIIYFLNEKIKSAKGSEEMKLSYTAPITDEKTLDLAGKIVRTLVDSGVTYQKANDALNTAQEMLMSQSQLLFCSAD